MEPQYHPPQEEGVGSRAAKLLLPIFMAPLLVCIIAAVLLWLFGVPAQ